MTHQEFEILFTEGLYKIPKPLAIALDRPWHTLSGKEIEFLSKIATSVRLSLARIQIIDSQYPPFENWMDKPDKMVGFGIAMQGAGLYELATIPPTRLVLADSLPQLMEQESLKKKLWIALQQLIAS